MNRILKEKEYWNRNALDPDVDTKYISNIDTELCKKDLGKIRGKVLEIGCGVGRLLEKGYVGLDTSIEMVKIATERTGNNIVLGDGRTLPFEDESFDTVFCYLVFQHIPPDAVRSYIIEAHRVLKDKGVFIFQWIFGEESEPFSYHYSYEFILSCLENYYIAFTDKSHAHTSWRITRAIK